MNNMVGAGHHCVKRNKQALRQQRPNDLSSVYNVKSYKLFKSKRIVVTRTRGEQEESRRLRVWEMVVVQ